MEVMQETKVILRPFVKQILFTDAALAAKIINRLGGGISLTSYNRRIERNSKSFLKEPVLAVIAKHLKTNVEDLTEEVPI